MTQSHDTNPGPDRELGALLREHMSGEDTARFVARVLERIPVGSNLSAWEILAGWARPGLAAALLLATVTGFWMVVRQDARDRVEVLAVEGLDGGHAVGGDGLLAAVLAGER